jgi:MSHA biogenesis protein MshP
VSGRLQVRARGSALIAALFLVVVVAALGTFAIRIGVNQQQTVDLALLGDRAYSAANGGIEFGAYQAFNTPWCTSSTTVSQTVAFTQGGLNGFNATVRCARTDHVDGTTPVHIYNIDVFAWSGAYGTSTYIARQMSARFTDAP